MLPVLQRLENPKRCVTFPVKLFAKSQTIKKFSTFRFFWLSFFFDFSSKSLLNCKLFEFSTFRGRKSWFSRSDRYQPEQHTAQIRVPPNVTLRNFIFPTIWWLLYGCKSWYTPFSDPFVERVGYIMLCTVMIIIIDQPSQQMELIYTIIYIQIYIYIKNT
jgi:hypothetical protein